jgi:hypothetical protein
MSRRNRFLLVCALFAAPLVLVGCSGKDDSGIDAPVGVKGNGPPPPPPQKNTPQLGTGG